MSSDIEIIPVADPQAVVILLGWMGSQLKTLRKYAPMYTDRKCSVVLSKCEPRDLIFQGETKRQTRMNTIISDALQLFPKDSESFPVLIHCFSNGGYFYLMELFDGIKSQQNHDYELLAPHLKAIIYDSCPAHPDFSIHMTAIAASIPNNFVLRLAAQSVVAGHILLNAAVSFVTGRKPMFQEFWDYVQTQTVVLTEAYIYSTADPIVNSERLEELIRYRKERHGSDIAVKKFDDSGHVLHYREHPKEYVEFISQQLWSVGIRQ